MEQPIRELTFDKNARAKLKAGVDKLAKAVITTLGPRGRNVAIDKPWGDVDVIHDGVSVAKEVFLEDKFENMGAQLVKQAAQKTNDQAGDGTTTATLIAKSIIDLGMRAIEEDEINPMFMKRGIDYAIGITLDELKKSATPVKKEDWIKVATISAQNKEIGKKISEALELVGEDGLVAFGEGSGSRLEVEHTKGMELDVGYLSPYFATNSNTMETEFEDAFILITDARLSSSQPLINILKKAQGAGKPMLIITDKLDGEALATLVLNKVKGNLQICAISAPSIGEGREAILEDIAIMTGGSVVSSNTGIKIEEVELEHCGIAKKVVVTKDTTKIIDGSGTKEAIEDRVKQIKAMADKQDNDFQKTRLDERAARLTKGVAMVQVGAPTEVELKELKERVRDAVGATKAAIEEGVIPGGGVELLKISKKLDSMEHDPMTEDEIRGLQIVAKALIEPIKWLAKNSGEDPKGVIAKIEANQDKKNYGFNASSLEFGDLLAMGVIDPVKVTRLAIENGASVASMILTTDALITDKRQPEKKE